MLYVNQTKSQKRYLTLKREIHMKTLFASATLAIGLMASAGAFAKANEVTAPAGTPVGTTGVCNDGSMNMTPTKNGACLGHKGIKVWYTASTTKAPAATSTAPAAAPATTPAAPAKKGLMSMFSKKPATTTTAAVATTSAAASSTTAPAMTTPAAGGGAGQVWVNMTSKVYHCSSSKYYGKTKAGQYMTEAAAKAAGARPDHGKACS